MDDLDKPGYELDLTPGQVASTTMEVSNRLYATTSHYPFRIFLPDSFVYINKSTDPASVEGLLERATSIRIEIWLPGALMDAARIFVAVEPNGHSVLTMIYEPRADALKWLELLISELRKRESEKTAPSSTSGSAVEQMAHSSTKLPPITDPTDKLIYAIVRKDPSLSDMQVAAKLPIKNSKTGLPVTRQAVNARRRALAKMGYKVRGGVKTD